MHLSTLALNLFTIYIPLLVLGLYMPNYNKSTLVFGVNIPEDIAKSDVVRKLKKQYYRNYSISVSLSIGLIYLIAVIKESTQILNLGIIMIVLVLMVNYLQVHLKAKKMKAAEGWIEDRKQLVVVTTANTSKRRVSTKGHWYAAIIVIFTWLFTMIMYPHLPDSIPLRFDFSGEITAYGTKGFLTIFGTPLTQVGILTMFYLNTIIISKSKVTINPSKPKTSEEQNIRGSRRWGIFMILMSIMLNLYFLYLQLIKLQIIPIYSLTHIIINISTIVMPMGLLMVVALTTGQSGSRIKVKTEETSNDKVIYRDDDAFWKWGSIYYNPQDPSLWIEKRFGIGWTLNVGHPLGLVLTIITLLLLMWAAITSIIKIM